jgi:hypothetical protein
VSRAYEDGWLPMALGLAMRSVADGTSASGHSANGRSRLAEARWDSGLLVGSERMSSRGYDEMLPTFQKRRPAGEIWRVDGGEEARWAAETEQMGESWYIEIAANMDSNTQQDCICTTLLWLGSDVPPVRAKGSLPVSIGKRSTLCCSLTPLPCESWAGRAGLHGRYGLVSRLAALHSRIRAPQRNLVSSPKPLLLLACAGSAWMRVERSGGSVYSLLVSSLSSHIPACSACTGEVRLLGPSPSSTRTKLASLNSTAFPPTFWPGETPLPTYSAHT